MKIVKLMGGLGNQMFQYAFGQVIKADAYDVSWFEDVKNYPTVTPRAYELDFFKCSPHLTTLKAKKRNILSKLLCQISSDKIIKEKPANVYNPKLLKIKKGVFKGYFQCAQYCEAVRLQLLADFVPQNQPNEANQEILNKIKSTNSVSLHVRRGDYIQFQHVHGLCDLAYYQKAIDLIDSHVSNPHFFLFSDDIAWVEENLKIKFPYTIVDINQGKDSPWDIWLMKNCQHNIIANSSFSWWGAWLNENPNKIVIAPATWFSDGSPTDIIPHDWYKI